MEKIAVWEDQGLAWGSHLPALMACVAASEGPVLEFGSGHYSTPCLHALCAVLGRELVTVEPYDAWRELFECYASPTHRVMKLTEGLDRELAKRQWGVVFVDDAADARTARAEIFYRSAQFMLFHDYNFPDQKPALDTWLANNPCQSFIYQPPSLEVPQTLIVSKGFPIPVFRP